MLTYLIYIFKHDLFVIICQTLFSYFFLACITKNWLFMFPFFPNIVTFSIGLKGACTYSMWSIVEHLLSRVGSGEWRSLRTRNLAPSRSLTPQRIHPKFGTGTCSPTCYITRAMLPRLLWHGTFGFCEEYYIF